MALQTCSLVPIAVVDIPTGIFPRQATDIAIARNRTDDVAVADIASMVFAHQAADMIVPSDRTDDVALADPATRIVPHQAADISTAPDYNILDAYVVDLSIRANVAKEADSIRGGHINVHVANDIAVSIEDTGEVIIVVAYG